MSFFGVNVTNPFTSPVGQRIEQATDASLPSENWALNMEICDIINETEDGPRDAIKAIKRRLTQAAGKNYTIVMYTLTVLETCVKNCGKRFHALACSREFVQELVKLIGPKNEPPTAVQEKVLNLIQMWADTFQNQPHTQGVVQVYQELKAKGIEFPMTDLDAMAPIITPERSVPEVEATGATAAAAPAGAAAAPGAACSAAGAAALGQQQPQQPGRGEAVQACARGHNATQIVLNEQQMTKLRCELDVVHGNMRVFSEMLDAYAGGPKEDCPERDMDLFRALHLTCRQMQYRVINLIGTLAHDELTAELLHINDEMNNLFLRYLHFSTNKSVPASALVAQAIGANSLAAVMQKRDSEGLLIDLSDDEEGEAAGAAALPINALEKRIADIGITGESSDDGKSRRKEGEKDEFDAFAQSRTASFDTAKNRQELRGNDHDAESSLSRTKNSMQSDKTVTSSEFERFLAERTAAASMESPAAGSQAASSTATASASPTVQRQIDKDQEDKSLFAL